MAHTEPIIEDTFAPAYLPDALTLTREAGWNQVAADWEIFRALGTVFTAHENGRVVASAGMLPYGAFAWVSMVLVLPDHRRRGLGTRLLECCLTLLRERGVVPLLDATPAGLPLYRAMGFKETWGYQRLARAAATPLPGVEHQDGISVRTIADADRDALCAYDAAAFGANRSALLNRLRGRLPAAELVAERSGSMVGFMLGRNGRSASQIGPLVAEDEAIAQALLAHALPAFEGPVYIDLADSKAKLRAWLGDGGFAAQRPLTRMVLGRATGFDDPSRTFAVAGPELG